MLRIASGYHTRLMAFLNMESSTWPYPKMLQDLFDDSFVFNKGDDPHGTGTSGTHEGINFIYFLYQLCSFSPESLVGQLRFQNIRGLIVCLSFLATSPTYAAVVAIVTNHLFSLVGNARTHSSQPLQRIEHFGFLLVFGLVFHLAGFPMVGHPFPGERRTNNIPGQILHGFFIPGQNARPGEYVKSGMPPFIQK